MSSKMINKKRSTTTIKWSLSLVVLFSGLLMALTPLRDLFFGSMSEGIAKFSLCCLLVLMILIFFWNAMSLFFPVAYMDWINIMSEKVLNVKDNSDVKDCEKDEAQNQ